MDQIDQFFGIVELNMEEQIYEVHYSWTKDYSESYDCPPEPPQWEIENILDEDGDDVTGELIEEINDNEDLHCLIDGLVADDINSGIDCAKE